MIKKHTRPTQKNPQGGILEIEGTDPREQRDARLPELRRSRRASAASARGRHARARLQEVRQATSTSSDRRTAPPRERRGEVRRVGNPALENTRRRKQHKWHRDSKRSTGPRSCPALKEQLGYANVNEVPRLEKIVVNMGVGAASQDTKLLDAAIADLRIITGQKPVITRAKKSIAGFKIRQGMPIGAKVTLRGDRMWEFIDRLLATALPRIRDFRGISRRTASTAAATTRWASTSS